MWNSTFPPFTQKGLRAQTYVSFFSYFKNARPMKQDKLVRSTVCALDNRWDEEDFSLYSIYASNSVKSGEQGFIRKLDHDL